jgi:phage FluMu protein Com
MSSNTRIDILSNEPNPLQGIVEEPEFVDLQPKAETLISQLDIEIECPRCNEVLELYSDFDRLYYCCESCSLHLQVG